MTMTPEQKLAMARECAHCKNGWFEDQRFGCDVECVNGILIDIDEAHEGWQRDVIYRVAPCHPMWSRQCAGDEDFPNDCQQRLEEWRPMIDEVPNEDDIKRARLVFAHVNLIGELQRQAVERAFMAHRQATEARMQERVRAETDWQDIESAPRDATVIDLWAPDGDGYRVADAYWQGGPKRGGWWAPNWDHDGADGMLCQGNGDFTHWRPLPVPPAIRETPHAEG